MFDIVVGWALRFIRRPLNAVVFEIPRPSGTVHSSPLVAPQLAVLIGADDAALRQKSRDGARVRHFIAIDWCS
jgi:hypothetical protein